MTVSHFIVILLILTCQLAAKSNSHISQSFVASVYKPAFFQCYSVHFNFVQQCIQISTRINSTSVHTYILRLFYIASSIRIFILINPIFNKICQVWQNRKRNSYATRTPRTQVIICYRVSAMTVQLTAQSLKSAWHINWLVFPSNLKAYHVCLFENETKQCKSES